MPEEEKPLVWQPIMLVADHPVLCECGKPAIILTLEGSTEDFDYIAWCQACFEKEEDE